MTILASPLTGTSIFIGPTAEDTSFSKLILTSPTPADEVVLVPGFITIVIDFPDGTDPLPSKIEAHLTGSNGNTPTVTRTAPITYPLTLDLPITDPDGSPFTPKVSFTFPDGKVFVEDLPPFNAVAKPDEPEHFASTALGNWQYTIPTSLAFKTIKIIAQGSGGDGGSGGSGITQGRFGGGGGGGAGEMASITLDIPDTLRGKTLSGTIGNNVEINALETIPAFSAASGGNGGDGTASLTEIGQGGSGGSGGDSTTKVEGVTYVKGANGGDGGSFSISNELIGGQAGTATESNAPGSGGGGNGMVWILPSTTRSVFQRLLGGGTAGSRSAPSATEPEASGGGGAGGNITQPNTLIGNNAEDGGTYGAGGGGGAGVRGNGSQVLGGKGSIGYISILVSF